MSCYVVPCRVVSCLALSVWSRRVLACLACISPQSSSSGRMKHVTKFFKKKELSYEPFGDEEVCLVSLGLVVSCLLLSLLVFVSLSLTFVFVFVCLFLSCGYEVHV